jgi:hypothetical protein
VGNLGTDSAIACIAAEIAQKKTMGPFMKRNEKAHKVNVLQKGLYGSMRSRQVMMEMIDLSGAQVYRT